MGRVKGVVLCGGEGKRLRPITYYFQKTMIPIGRSQRPLLEYVLRLFKFHGIMEVILLVGYKAEQIVNYFEDGSRFNINVTYVYDDPKIKGTAGAIVNAYRKGAINRDDTLLVYYGDILTNMNLTDFLNYHRGKNAQATIALSRGFSLRVGVADLGKDGRITRFKEKPEYEKPVSIAIAALEGETLQSMEELIKNKRELDLMGEVIPYIMEKKDRVYGYITDAFWYDVGSTEAYEKLDAGTVDKALSFLYT
ncbi:MAG: nucleotidyltransferase family protein [Nitrososphaerota archaeon]|nr:nucleotidyltransferase family protein [Candidatus Bathyarchaeota archaeon]MDW8049414.1 nucleotidyltransferase family protein [Nitrososphaerota archaeon]